MFGPKSLREFFLLFSSDPKSTTLSPSFEPDQPPSTLSLPISPIWSRHRRPPSPIKNPHRSLHLRSKTLASPSIDDLTLTLTLTLHLLSHPQPSPHAPSPISTVTLHVNNNDCFETHLRLWLLLRDPSQALAFASRPISPCQFSWHSQRHRRTPWQTVSLFPSSFSLNLYGFMVVFFIFFVN